MSAQSPPSPTSVPSPVTDAEPSAAFTPGPWTIRDSQVSVNLCIYAQHRDGEDYGIGTAWNLSGLPENLANARLIAAAPDQHAALDDAEAALTALINRYGYEDDNATPKDWNEWVFARAARDAARAAIAKALGSSAQDTSHASDKVPGRTDV